jgi:glutamine cyclotransferase
MATSRKTVFSIGFTGIIITLLQLYACSDKKDQASGDAPQAPPISFKVVNVFRHDVTAFTEGLVVHEGKLYEGTGEDSWIGIVDIKTGTTDKKITFPKEFFGEGITILNNKIYQLTYRTKKGFVYDLNTFKELRTFSYDSEGWGLTNNGTYLIMSDGSDQLKYLDTTDFKLVKAVSVKSNGEPVREINELEYVNGSIYANIWKTNLIAKINPETGDITGILDLSSVTAGLRQTNPNIDVLNGIAWHAGSKSLLVTGKYWPNIYQLQLQ